MKLEDKVVCIHKIFDGVDSDLVEHKLYTIDFIHHLYHGQGIEVRVTINPYISYNSKRFVSLCKYRKIKLNKIKEKINETRR